jgi:TrkA domain protein
MRQADAMTEVTETQLPGVGVRHEFTTAFGERLAVLVLRTGRREIALYNRADPDAGSTVLHLSADDTRTLAELLGGGAVSEAVSGVQRLEGVAIDWIRVREGSAHVGVTIGERQLRTRTGSSVVAIVRGQQTVPAPGPDAVLHAGDVVVAVGTPEGLLQLHELLDA